MTFNTAVEGGGLVGVGAVATFMIGYLWKWIARKDERTDAQHARADKLAEHTGSLAIELLKMTQSEAAGLRQKMDELQAQLGVIPGLERRVAYLEEALLHIEALLDPASDAREAAEFNARAFLARMVRLRDDRGFRANLEQTERARRKLLGDEA